MHKKFEISRTKIKGSCQLGRKVVAHDSKSDLPLHYLGVDDDFAPQVHKLLASPSLSLSLSSLVCMRCRAHKQLVDRHDVRRCVPRCRDCFASWRHNGRNEWKMSMTFSHFFKQEEYHLDIFPCLVSFLVTTLTSEYGWYVLKYTFLSTIIDGTFFFHNPLLLVCFILM